MYSKKYRIKIIFRPTFQLEFLPGKLQFFLNFSRVPIKVDAAHVFPLSSMCFFRLRTDVRNRRLDKNLIIIKDIY